MDQIALRVTLTLLKNLSRKQIRPPSNMVDRTKEQLIMNIDPYVRVTEVKISFVNTNFIHKKFVRKYSRKMINSRISHRWTGSIIGASDTCVLTLTCQIFAQQILLFFWEKNTYTTFINFWKFSFKTWFSPTQMRKNSSYTALLGPTRLLISEIFPSKPDFHLHKWEKILPTQPY